MVQSFKLFSVVMLALVFAACGAKPRGTNYALKNPGPDFDEEQPIDYDLIELPWERGEVEPIQEPEPIPEPIEPEPDPEPQPEPTPGEDPNPSPSPTPKPIGPKQPVKVRKYKAAWDRKSSGAAYTAFTVNALEKLGKKMLATDPLDATNFCPNFANLKTGDRKQVYVMLISAMAYFESSFRPKLFFKEKFNNSKNEPVISRGLLQISSESANAYGCGVKKETDLEDPQFNLECTVRILNKWIPADKLIGKKVEEKWRGGARYWAVLRSARTVPVIRKAVRSLEVCASQTP